ncbi:MAG: polysaccharide pyruvyl transferase family protein [Bacteroides sp.]
MNKNRVAIVTWVKYHNFGSFLQAYALQRTIEDMGYDVSILDDRDVIEEGRKDSPALSLWKRLRYRLAKSYYRLVNYRFISLCTKSDRLYEAFKSQYLNVDTEVKPFTRLDNKYEQFVCGSDQIWAPSLMIFSPYYYLAFTSKKKIAYAPSVGFSHYPDSFKSKVKPLLNRFAHLSVREQLGADIIQNIVQRPVSAVLDPTLLLSADQWSALSLSSSIVFPSKYIFCYFLSKNDDYLNFVQKFASDKQLPVILFAVEGRNWHWGTKMLAGGPIEFLKAIKHASYVFTDSFHGTIFSIHFEKRFITFKRFSESDSQNQNSRISNLLGKLNLEEYFIGKDNWEEIDRLRQIDYSEVSRYLQKECTLSIDYLRNALTN